MILIIGVISMSVHSLTSEVGIESKSHDLVGEDIRILRMSSSDTSSKEDKALLLMLGLVIEIGADYCSAVLIFIILSLKKCPKELARCSTEPWGYHCFQQ